VNFSRAEKEHISSAPLKKAQSLPIKKGFEL
jgi:hypothetical protein